jgi:hypothetical protein
MSIQNDRDSGRSRSLDLLARSRTYHLEARERLAHHATAALGKRDEVLAQMSEVLFDREATDSGPLSASTHGGSPVTVMGGYDRPSKPRPRKDRGTQERLAVG